MQPKGFLRLLLDLQPLQMLGEAYAFAFSTNEQTEFSSASVSRSGILLPDDPGTLVAKESDASVVTARRNIFP